MKKSKLKVGSIIFLSLVILVWGAFYIYTLDYNTANAKVYDMEGFSEAKTAGNMTIIMPPSDVEIIEGTGCIFYPMHL